MYLDSEEVWLLCGSSSEFRAVWFGPDMCLSGPIQPKLARFALGALAGIRTCGSWRRAAEERKRPRWVKVQGCVHSAVRGTEKAGHGSAVVQDWGVPLDSGWTRNGYWRVEDWEWAADQTESVWWRKESGSLRAAPGYWEQWRQGHFLWGGERRRRFPSLWVFCFLKARY